ncbi:protein RIC-3 [Xenentodon cancila]
MTITTCQKVTLISCSVLCVSLFLPRMVLPRGKKEKGQPEVGPGFYPSVMHQLAVPEDQEDWDVDPPSSLTHTVEIMAKMKIIGKGKKYNLMAQVIPIYGFGILLYILYIIYKLTCKGKRKKSRSCSAVTNANMSNITPTNYELARLQERLLQTEMMLERIVTGRSSSSSGRRRKSKTSITKKEEKLLRQLRQITLLMQEGRLEGASPEMEAEEVPYDIDWEGYPEETYPEKTYPEKTYPEKTYPEYHEPCDNRRFDTIMLEEPASQPTAEALAERMEQEEEEIIARKLSIVQEEDEEEEDREEEDEEEEEEVEDEEEDIEEELEDMEEEEQKVEEEAIEEDDEVEEGEKKPLLTPPQPGTKRKQERAGLEVSKELQHHSGAKKQIRFSAQRHVFRYPKEDTFEEEEEGKEAEAEEEEGTEVEDEDDIDEDDDDDEDPLMEAESLQFSSEDPLNPIEAEEDKEECLLQSASVQGEGRVHAASPEVGVSGLRMRNRRET